jgi:hypothetical protein
MSDGDHLDWLRRVEEAGGQIYLSEEQWGVAVPVPMPDGFPDLLLEVKQHPEWDERLEAIAVGRGETEDRLYERMFRQMNEGSGDDQE